MRPDTLKMMAQFAVLSRLKEPENSSIFSKMRVYDGENLEGHRPQGQELPGVPRLRGRRRRHDRAIDPLRLQGLSKIFNFDHREVAANPVHLMYVLEQQIEAEQFRRDRRRAISATSRNTSPALRRVHRQGDPDRLPRELLRVRAEHLRPLRDLRRLLDPGPGVPRPEHRRDPRPRRAQRGLEKIEKPAGISNPKDFRNEVVNFVLRARKHEGRNPSWTSYEKLRAVIEKKMFSNTEDLLPVISFNAKGQRRRAEEAPGLVDRMIDKGYTEKQVRLLCEWYLRVRKAS